MYEGSKSRGRLSALKVFGIFKMKNTKHLSQIIKCAHMVFPATHEVDKRMLSSRNTLKIISILWRGEPICYSFWDSKDKRKSLLSLCCWFFYYQKLTFSSSGSVGLTAWQNHELLPGDFVLGGFEVFLITVTATWRNEWYGVFSVFFKTLPGLVWFHFLNICIIYIKKMITYENFLLKSSANNSYSPRLVYPIHDKWDTGHRKNWKEEIFWMLLLKNLMEKNVMF